jgi:hypothetical protein
MESKTFKEFVNKKLNKTTINEQQSKKVSSNLLKNIIDVLKEFIVTEYDLSEDAKMQIVNNMKIEIESHDKGVSKDGPKFIATSNYDEGEGKTVPVEIYVEIVTEKIGQKQSVDPAEESDVPDEMADDIDMDDVEDVEPEEEE